ncbi:class I SAM-dependent methyltransferase (plasmid) [Nostoc sp. C052]|jgi:ubiquinone/menaquinone biosynthesis C-methylase UbiE|uniref:SAM-dependent methyltransferase n=2 Tax=Nostoc TaxID=1177 RepID=UPI0015C2CDFF|nr:class I SAM-dependent methyltransferase [Nostoc sp. C052]MBD2511696.1 class I SAM-dependent methyltransferase [Desmonostoc muscorum FACHB-395]QLE45932.1 class I SAM-dependent methyltransferase [Nostoc sp. C052]
MTQTTVNLTTAPSHVVLAAAGKTVLRPGGRAATEQLFEWANFQPGETVLELASGLGNSAIALAKRYNVQVVGIERDPDRVAIAQVKARSAGLDHRVEFIQGNIFQLKTISASFDYVLAEAILTMQTSAGKAKILTGVRDRLKVGGKFLSHELLARDHLESLRPDLTQVTRVNATPLPERDWINTFAQLGLTVTQRQIGAMRLLEPIQVLRDEGVIQTVQIVWNILTQPLIRDRILMMRRVFTQHQQDLGYIALCAVREL